MRERIKFLPFAGLVSSKEEGERIKNSRELVLRYTCQFYMSWAANLLPLLTGDPANDLNNSNGVRFGAYLLRCVQDTLLTMNLIIYINLVRSIAFLA